jgi:biotin-(acetyl-CoA carboxylase) ligase
LLDALYAALTEFGYCGFAPFADEWRRADYLLGRPVAVQTGADRQLGTAAGIAADGALLLDRGGEISAVLSGEVTIRDAA